MTREELEAELAKLSPGAAIYIQIGKAWVAPTPSSDTTQLLLSVSLDGIEESE